MRTLSIGLLLVAFAVPAFAQGGSPTPPQPTRVHVQGTIVSVVGDVMTVKGDDGQSTPVQLTAASRISAHAKRELADIQQGSFVGSAAVPGSDGRLHAQEVHIFPESMRGTGEGHRAMQGGAPDRTMTNAAVTQVSALVLEAHDPGMPHSPPGPNDPWVLTMQYSGGTQDIVVDPGTPIFAIVPGDRSWLTPAMAVSLFGEKAADGTITARTVFVEHGGQKPMM